MRSSISACAVCRLAFSENSYYGCGHASEVDTGLTSLGRQAIKRMNRLGIVIDLSHSGDRTALEALELFRAAGDLQPLDQPDVIQPARAAPPIR